MEVEKNLTVKNELKNKLNDEFYNIIAEFSSDLISKHQQDGTCTFVSPSIKRLLGYDPQEFINQSIYKYIHAEDLISIQNQYSLVPDEPETREFAFRIRCKNGSYVWFETTLRSFKDSETSEAFEIWTSQDISRRKEAERILIEKQNAEAALKEGLNKVQESHWLLTSILKNLNDGIVFKDLNGRILVANPTYSSMTGRPLDELIGKTASQLFPEEIGKRLEELDRKLLTSGESNVEEYVLPTPQGLRTFKAERIPFRDMNGLISGILVVSSDISEFKHREKVFRKSESDARMVLDAAFDSIPHIVWTAKPNGWVDYYNRGWVEYTGMAVERTISQGWGSLLHPEDLQPYVDRWIHAITTGESYEVEIRLKHKDGLYRWFLARAVPIRDHDSRIVKWFGTCTDINDQKRAEAERARLSANEQAALEASRLKSEFLAHMSHEIRTPLNGVLGMSGLLLSTGLDEEQKEFATIIKNSGESLLTVVNDILDFSKIESGKLELELVDFNLRELVQDLARLFRHVAEKKGLELNVEIDSGIPACFKGDAVRFKQVLMNLMNNAIRFTETGRVNVFVRNCSHSAVSGQLRIEVADTGIGIPEDVIPKLFNPFFQADSSTTRKYGGTGLGLSICKNLMTLMNGQIGVVSRLGHGSTFWFTVQLEEVSAVPLKKELCTKTINMTEKGQVRILLAEDNPVNQAVAARTLEKQGFKVEIVENGHRAIEAIQKNYYDLVLMDCQMPVMDGYDAATEIRKLEKHTGKRIPIIAFTAGALKDEEARCLKSGMDDYVTKPIRIQKFLEKVQKWLPQNSNLDHS
jgi:PAS domain S-box-containing protein